MERRILGFFSLVLFEHPGDLVFVQLQTGPQSMVEGRLVVQTERERTVEENGNPVGMLLLTGDIRDAHVPS